MKKRFLSTYIIAIFSCLLLSCSGQTNTSSNNTDKDSIKEVNIEKVSIVEEENMIDISKYLSEEENNFMKKLAIRSHRQEDLDILENGLYEDGYGFGFEDTSFDFVNDKIVNYNDNLETSDQLNMEYDIIYKILLGTHPMFKPVPSSLYEKKFQDIFGIKNNINYRYDEDRQVLEDPRFLIYILKPSNDCRYYVNGIKSVHNENETYYHINDFTNHVYYDIFYREKNIFIPNFVICMLYSVDFDVFINGGIDLQWFKGGFLSKKYKEHNDILTARDSIYEKCMKEGKLYAYKTYVDMLFHYNNYIFYYSKSSLTWLLNDENGRILLKRMFAEYNYDKEPSINKMFFNDIKTECFDKDGFKGIYCDPILGTDIYGNRVYHENMLKYLVDNCYDPKDKDDLGLENCDIIEYLLRYVSFPKENSNIEGYDCHLLTLLGYYQLKAFDVYVEKSGAAPSCWVDLFAESLYNQTDDCESLFYKKIKEENFYGLDFAERCQNLYDEYRGKFKGGSPD